MKLFVNAPHRPSHGLEIVTVVKNGELPECGHSWIASFLDGTYTVLTGRQIAVQS